MFSGTVIIINRRVHFERGGLLVRSLSAVGFLKDALVTTRLAAFTRRILLSTDALHLETTTIRACPGRCVKTGSLALGAGASAGPGLNMPDEPRTSR